MEKHATLPSNLYFAEQIRQGEQECAKQLRVDMYQLMEQAGHAVFETFLAHFAKVKKILIVAGRGNNGGDAYVFARLAMQSNYDVQLYSFKPQQKLKGDAEIARQSYLATGASILDLENMPDRTDAELVVDGLLGIGYVGDMRKETSNVINLINSWQIPVIAIDLPSGLNSDTGTAPCGAISAQFTVTFVALKVGLFTANGPDLAGEISFAVLDIGSLFEQLFTPSARLLKSNSVVPRIKRLMYSNKGTYGHVVCIGGDEGMAGAIYLSAKSALRCGAGKVSVICHQSNTAVVTSLCPELMVIAGSNEIEKEAILNNKLKSASCIILGPGLGQSAWSKMIFNWALQRVSNNQIPLVLDADGLNLLSNSECNTHLLKSTNKIFTPHPLEAARLLNCSVAEIAQNRLQYAQNLSNKYNALCVLKGNGSVIADHQDVAINSSGHPGMATAGMGDVLAGIIAGVISSGCKNNQALVEDLEFSVYLHGFSAELAAKNGEVGMIASDVIDHLPLALSYN